MKKRLLACLLAAVMTASLFAACSSKEDTAPSEGNSQNQEDTSTEEAKEPALADVVQAVKDAYGENYIPSMEITQQELADVCGITTENIEEVIAEGPMMSGHVDRLFAIKAVEGKGEDVEKEVAAYQKVLQEDTLMYPMIIAKVQSSQVVRHGDYVFFVMLGAFDEESTTEEAQQVFADEQTKIGTDAIASFF